MKVKGFKTKMELWRIQNIQAIIVTDAVLNNDTG